MKISLIIAAYNEEKYIGECIKSVIENANGKLHEIIVVDNNSTDRTKDIASSFPGVIVVTEKERGASVARQRGYLTATGDLLAFLDADNHMPPLWVEKVINEFTQHPDIVGLSGPYAWYDFSKFGSFLTLVYWYVFAYPLYLCVGYMALAGNLIIKKEVMDKMGGFDTSLMFFGDDTNISRRASKFGKFKFKLNLVMYSSARRLKGQGILKMAYFYGINFFSQVFMKKSVTSGYVEVR